MKRLVQKLAREARGLVVELANAAGRIPDADAPDALGNAELALRDCVVGLRRAKNGLAAGKWKEESGK